LRAPPDLCGQCSSRWTIGSLTVHILEDISSSQWSRISVNSATTASLSKYYKKDYHSISTPSKATTMPAYGTYRSAVGFSFLRSTSGDDGLNRGSSVPVVAVRRENRTRCTALSYISEVAEKALDTTPLVWHARVHGGMKIGIIYGCTRISYRWHDIPPRPRFRRMSAFFPLLFCSFPLPCL
jgi:hypothetical protein